MAVPPIDERHRSVPCPSQSASRRLGFSSFPRETKRNETLVVILFDVAPAPPPACPTRTRLTSLTLLLLVLDARRTPQAPGPVLDACFAEAGSTSVVSGGLAKAVTRHDLIAGAEDTVGAHDGAVKCVEYDEETGMIISGGWDSTLRAWDVRLPAERRCVARVDLPGKVYSMSLGSRRLVVATAGRGIHVYTPVGLTLGGQPEQTRESSIAHQTRCVRCLPDGTGYVVSSVEGRVAWEYFDPAEEVQAKKYAFKCHRAKDGGVETVHPVHAVAFHPWGTFATGGGDGLVNVWDGAHKKRLYQYPKYPTSVAALAFNAEGDKLAVAASYVGEEGEKEAPRDAIYVRQVAAPEVTPKSRQAGLAQ